MIKAKFQDNAVKCSWPTQQIIFQIQNPLKENNLLIEEEINWIAHKHFLYNYKCFFTGR